MLFQTHRQLPGCKGLSQPSFNIRQSYNFCSGTVLILAISMFLCKICDYPKFKRVKRCYLQLIIRYIYRLI